MTPGEFAEATNVSRETLERFEIYAALLKKYQSVINLVAPNSLGDLWRRHFLDSAQLYPLLVAARPRANAPLVLLDLGSGAGFPGLVLALLAQGEAKPIEIHLVESDVRKSAFLREVARATNVSVTIHPQRMEDLAPFPVDVLTARAVAPLSKLIDIFQSFIMHRGHPPMVLALKGKQAREELTEAAKEWKMTAEAIASITDPDASVLRLSDISRG